MSKVLWHITMSLDGFITGPGGDMSWLGDYTGPNATVDEVIPQIGALLIGNRTFTGGADTAEGVPYGGLWSGPMFVLTHRASPAPVDGFAFVGDLAGGLAAAKAAAGDRYVVLLGADVARQCLAAGELDEILVHQAPLLLGGGVRLFERAGGGPVRLERRSLTPAANVTDEWFRVLR